MFLEDDWNCETKSRKMDNKNKHPFVITCRYCGGGDIRVTPFEYGDLEIKCNSCGTYVSCGTYYTMRNNYSGMTHKGGY